jgi:hypothetical protein
MFDADIQVYETDEESRNSFDDQCCPVFGLLAFGRRQVLGPDDYSGSFSMMFGRVFTVMGGTLSLGSQRTEDPASFGGMFSTVEDLALGLSFLTEWAARGRPNKWYLGPTLNNPELQHDVPRGVLDNLPRDAFETVGHEQCSDTEVSSTF